ncbi:MAG: response regulator [candidate division Zixibacteria bacterium]|nr:response regulator [candidate division Zixibacteria bacterium]
MSNDADKAKSKILIVDDEEFNRKLLKGILASTGHDVFEAVDGMKALELAKENPPDIILLDIMMPGMDGFSVCRKLKDSDKTNDIPILMITSLNEVDDYVRAVDSGADDFITKPVNATAILARIKGFLRNKQLSDKVKHINRFKNDLTRMIVHDLRGPMTGIMGYLDLSMNSDSISSKVREYLQNALSSAHDVSGLIDNLLGIEKLESGTLTLNPEPVHIPSLIQHNIDVQNANIIQSSLKVELQGPRDLICRCDQNLMNRVIQNMLVNAIKFSPENSVIKIEWESNSREFNYSVTNHGESIDPEYQAVIFNKFAQLDDRPALSRGGVGLGLAFCKMAVDAHGGSMELVSPATGFEDGVQFIAKLPLKKESAASSRASIT